MKYTTPLLLALLLLFTACSKSSSDPSPTSADKGYGYVTFRGKTYYFQSQPAQIPLTGLLTMSATAIDDTVGYNLSINISPNPAVDSATFPISVTSGTMVSLIVASTQVAGRSTSHFYFKPGEAIRYRKVNGKIEATVANLTETTNAMVPISGGLPLSAQIKFK